LKSTALLSGITLQPGTLRAVLLDRLTRSLGKDPETATQRDVYNALSLAIREEFAARWLATQRRTEQAAVKRVCYLSVEYLLGRSLINGLASLDGALVEEARAALEDMGFDLDRVAEEEIDPGLGNGGLGRLAACFLDSMATLGYPSYGYGLRYDYGIFQPVQIASIIALRHCQSFVAEQAKIYEERRDVVLAASDQRGVWPASRVSAIRARERCLKWSLS
jgi:starch phosphorylase